MNFKIFKHKLVDFLSEDPNFSAINGFHKLLGDLPDPGKNKRISNQGKLKMFSNLLKRVDVKNLSISEREEYYYSRNLIVQSENHLNIEIEEIPQCMKKPQAVEIIFDPIYYFFYFDSREPKFRLVNIVSRLNKVPEFINNYVRNLKLPVKSWVEIEIQKIETIGVFLTELETWAVNEQFKNVKALGSSITKTRASFARYRDLLLASDFSIKTVIGPEQASSILSPAISNVQIERFSEFNKELCANTMTKLESLKSKIISKYDLNNDISLNEIETFLRERKLASNDVNNVSDIYTKLNSFCLDKKLISNESKLFNNFDLSNHTAIQPPTYLDDGLIKQSCFPYASREIKTFGDLFELTQVTTYDSMNISFFRKSSSNFLFLRRSFSDHIQNYYLGQLLQDLILENGYFEECFEGSLFLAARSIYNKILFSAIELCFMTGDISYLSFVYKVENGDSDLIKSAKKVLNQKTVINNDLIDYQLNLCSQNKGKYVLFVQNYCRFLNSNEDIKNELYCHLN